MAHTVLLIVAIVLFVMTALQPMSSPGWTRNLAWGLAALAASFVNWNGLLR
jgi:hypothetical protein